MIEIKSYYGIWKPVTRDEARRFVKLMIKGFTAISSRNDKIKRINEYHLRGETVEKLFG